MTPAERAARYWQAVLDQVRAASRPPSSPSSPVAEIMARLGADLDQGHATDLRAQADWRTVVLLGQDLDRLLTARPELRDLVVRAVAEDIAGTPTDRELAADRLRGVVDPPTTDHRGPTPMPDEVRAAITQWHQAVAEGARPWT